MSKEVQPKDDLQMQDAYNRENNKTTSKDSQDRNTSFLSQNRINSGQDSLNRNVIITSKIHHDAQEAKEETVPGITHDRQIKKYDKPKSGGPDQKSTNELMVYKDVSHRSIVKEDRMKKVDGPILSRNLQSKGNQGSSSTSEKQDSILNKHTFEKKLERVESEYPGGINAEQHFERAPALASQKDQAPVISIYPKSMDVTFVKDSAGNDIGHKTMQQQKRLPIPITETSKARYKNSQMSSIHDQASRTAKPQAKSVKSLKKSQQFGMTNDGMVQISPHARLLGVNQHHLHSLQTMAFGSNSNQSLLPQLKEPKVHESQQQIKNTHGLLNHHYTTGRIGQNIPVKQPISQDGLKLAGQSVNLKGTGKYHNLRIRDVQFSQQQADNDHMRISQNQSIEQSNLSKGQIQNTSELKMAGENDNKKATININDIQEIKEKSSSFDSPEVERQLHPTGQKMRETQYKILISEGPTQAIADIHRVTNSGKKIKMTDKIAQDRDRHLNSSGSSHLKASRSNTHSIIKRTFPMHNQPGHDSLINKIMQPMPLDNTDRERQKLGSDHQSDKIYYVKVQKNSNSVQKDFHNSLSSDMVGGHKNNVKTLYYHQNLKQNAVSTPSKAMHSMQPIHGSSRFQHSTKLNNVYVVEAAKEKPISVKVSHGNDTLLESQKMKKLSQQSKQQQDTTPMMKSNTEGSRLNFEKNSFEGASIHKRVDSLFENAEKAIRANAQNRLANEKGQSDMKIKVNSSNVEEKVPTVKQEPSSIGPFASEEKHMLNNSHYQIPNEAAEGSQQPGGITAVTTDIEMSKQIVKEVSITSPGIFDKKTTEKELENTITRFIQNNLPAQTAQNWTSSDKYYNTQMLGQSYYGLNFQQNLNKAQSSKDLLLSRNIGNNYFSQSHTSFQKVKAAKNNPAGHSFDQDKLLDIIKKQQETIHILRKTIERLEKDVTRFRSELNVQKNANVDIQDQQVNSISPSRFNQSGFGFGGSSQAKDVLTESYFSEVERTLILRGLDIDEGLQTFRKYVGQLKSEIQMLKDQGNKKESTIKRYRKLMNETLEKKNKNSRDALNQTQTFQTALPFDQISRHKYRDTQLSPKPNNNLLKKKVSIDEDRFGLKQMKNYISSNGLRPETQDLVQKKDHLILDSQQLNDTKQGLTKADDEHHSFNSEQKKKKPKGTPDSVSTGHNNENRLEQQDSIHEIAHYQSRQEINNASQHLDNHRHSPVISHAATSAHNTTNVGKSTILNQQSRQVVLTTFNHNRMGKLMTLVQNIWKAKDFAKVMNLTLQSVTQIFTCNSGIFVAIDPLLMKNQALKNTADLIQTTQFVENAEITVIQSATMETLNNDPAFAKLSDARTPIFTSQFISYPIIDSQNRMLATIQIESKKIGGSTMQGGHEQSLNQNQSMMQNSQDSNPYQNQQPSKSIKKLGSNIKGKKQARDESTGKGSDASRYRDKQSFINAGFPMIDQHTISLLSSILSLKFDQLQSQKNQQDMQQEVIHTIELAGIICTQRSQPELVRLLKKHLPIYFGFQGVGVLLKDQKSDLLFTLNELDDGTHGDKRFSLDANQDRNEARKNVDELDDKEKAIRFRDLRKMEKITIPSSLGMSGVASNSGLIQFSNNPDTEKNFQKDVDNQAGINNVKNILIGPVYGHRNDYLQDLHPEVLSKQEITENKKKQKFVSELNKPDKTFKEIEHSHPIGIIQLVNKNEYRDITDYDKRKFEAIQNLIGLSIDNTQEYNSIINIRLGMYHSMTGIIDGLKQMTELQRGQSTYHPIKTVIDEMKSMTEKQLNQLGLRQQDIM